jgi:hypothetical protein
LQLSRDFTSIIFLKKAIAIRSQGRILKTSALDKGKGEQDRNGNLILLISAFLRFFVFQSTNPVLDIFELLPQKFCLFPKKACLVFGGK